MATTNTKTITSFPNMDIVYSYKLKKKRKQIKNKIREENKYRISECNDSPRVYGPSQKDSLFHI